MEIKKIGSYLKTNAECLCAWAMLSKDFNGWGVASLNFIQGQTTSQMGIYICICAHPGNIHYTITKNTLQKPPSMLNQIQFGNSSLYCVVKVLKKEKCFDISFLCSRGVTLQTGGIKDLLKTFNSFLSPFELKEPWAGCSSVSFMLLFSFTCLSFSL